VPLDLDAKKTVLRQFSYGLYAVTAEHNGERGIFTANWLSQVSFEPPMVAVSVERESSTLPLIHASGRLAICPFTADQRDLAAGLGRPRSRAGDKFVTLHLPTIATAAGPPALSNALGYVVCEVRQEVSAGDSIVLLTEVIEARVLDDGLPLVMRDAGFRHAG